MSSRRDSAAEQYPLQPELEPGRSQLQVPVRLESAESERRNPGQPPSLLLLAVARPVAAAPVVAALVAAALDAGPVSSSLESQVDTAAVPYRADLIAAPVDTGEAAAASLAAEPVPDRARAAEPAPLVAAAPSTARSSSVPSTQRTFPRTTTGNRSTNCCSISSTASCICAATMTCQKTNCR